MPKLDVKFAQAPYSQPYSSVGLDLLDNFYVEIATSTTSKVEYYYVGIHGLHRLQGRTIDAPCRGMITVNGRTFGVWGANFQEITNGGATRATLGTLKTSSGIVRFAENGYQVILVDGQYGYIMDLVSGWKGRITDEYFPDPSKGPTHVVCADGYFLVNSKGTNKYYWSAQNYIPYAFVSTSPGVKNLWWGLNYGEKIGISDNIVGVISVVNLLFVFGSNSMECHFDTMNTRGQIWARQENTLVNFGCLAPDSLSRYGNSVFWLGQDDKGTVGVFTTDTGFQPKRVSTRGVESRIAEYSQVSDCWSYSYAIDGHAFIVFNFPSGTSVDGGAVTGATWVYDVVTNTWTRRTRWDVLTGSATRYQGQHATYNWGKVILGDQGTDALYWLDSDRYYNETPTGEVEYIQGLFTSPISYDNNKLITYTCVQINHQPGFAPRSGQGSDPVWMMSSSNDTGVTFGYERNAGAGKTGHYAHRTRWPMCAMARNKVFKWRITDPIKRVVTGYTIEFWEHSR